MLREMIAVWKHQQFMKSVVEEFGQMLKDDEHVLNTAWGALAGEVEVDSIKESIHDKDKSVNKHERDIRRRLLEHLSINPGQDVSGCLVMMSLVKDAERIGDYSKNIYDVAVMLHKDAKQMKYFAKLAALHGRIKIHMGQLEGAFVNGNQDAAQLILKEYGPIKDECSQILNDIFLDDLPSREAIATALLSRFLKRINSHISNIASGLVYPLDQIDFVRGGILDD